MGFLKKSNAPSELPELAMKSIEPNVSVQNELPSGSQNNVIAPVVTPVQPIVSKPQPELKPVQAKPEAAPASEIKKLVAGEDYLEVSHNESAYSDIKKVIDEDLLKARDISKSSFFDNVLEDLNGGLTDVGKLEDWYEKKFVKEDVVSNMKGYWEGNKSDIIIKSFGAEYKKQIVDKVKVLQKLEEDWREIYFKLIKKEEEMKKEERGLKETVSEFVDLCKGRKNDDEKKGKRIEPKAHVSKPEEHASKPKESVGEAGKSVFV